MATAAPVMLVPSAKPAGSGVMYEPQPWGKAGQLLDILPDRGVIPLPFISQRIGLNPASQSLAVKEGVIKTARKTSGQGGCYFVTRDQAEEILTAVACAHVAGVAVTVMLRALRNMGVSPRDLLRLIPSTRPTGRMA